MLMFEDMFKVYSGPAASFSNLSLQKRYFHKFYYFSDHVYFQLPWFLKRAVAEALKLQKMTVTFRHMSFTGQIFDTGFKGDVFYLEFHLKYVNFNRPKTVCHGINKCLDISRTVRQSRLIFFTNLLLLLKALNHESLSKTQHFCVSIQCLMLTVSFS